MKIASAATRGLACALTCALTCALVSASQGDGKGADGLKSLAAIKVPHTFTGDEIEAINGQLDTLKLGIDLFLARDASASEEDHQKAFTLIWPMVRCLFSKDFDALPLRSAPSSSIANLLPTRSLPTSSLPTSLAATQPSSV